MSYNSTPLFGFPSYSERKRQNLRGTLLTEEMFRIVENFRKREPRPEKLACEALGACHPADGRGDTPLTVKSG